MLPASAVRREDIRPTTQTLKAANGTEIGVLGQATVSFQTHSFTSTVTGLVSNHVAEVVLGVDWLTENKVTWNFQEATVRLGGHHNRLRRTPGPVGQQARWLEQMEEYDFIVEHRSGSKHANADAMSRRPCKKKECMCQEDVTVASSGRVDQSATETHVIAGVRLVQQKNQPPEVVSEEQINPSESHGDADPPWSVDSLCAAQRADPDIGFIIRLIESFAEQPSWESVSSESSDVKTLWKLWPRLRIQDGLLKRRIESIDGKSERWQVVLPKELRSDFLTHAHGGMTGGHLGLKKTTGNVQSRAYWPTWSSDVSEFLKRCPQCARYHRVAKEQLRAAAERRKVTYDARVKKNTYQAGDQVWYYYPRRYSKKSPKWQRCYTGPYWIVRSIPPVSYVIQRTERSKPFVVHMNKLKKCYLHQANSGGRPIVSIQHDVPSAMISTPDEQEAECPRVSRDNGRLRARPAQLPRRFRD